MSAEPERVDLETPDLAAEKRAAFAELFPGVLADGVLDASRLGELLDTDVIAPAGGRERFGLTWAGKQDAVRALLTPGRGTLIPEFDKSIDFDDARHVFIEGDNLEVLKLLQKAYNDRVKLIYIDPPYNTGKEFVYSDDFSDTLGAYLAFSGQLDADGNRTSATADRSGRRHSRWLSMMYPRLVLARNLLTQDGAIFVSIDDNEVAHLRALMDEVFGPENFIACLIWNAEGHTDNQFQVKVMHEYILLYAREATSFEAGYFVDPNTRKESNLWRGVAENSITKNGPKNPPSWITLPVGFPCSVDQVDLPASSLTGEAWQLVEDLRSITRDVSSRLGLVFPLRKAPLVVRNGRLSYEVAVYSGWANAEKLKRFIAGGCTPLTDDDGSSLEFYLSDRGVVYYRRHREGLARNIVSVLRNVGTTEKMRSELESRGIYFDYPKPCELLQALIQIGGASGDDLVIDFFAGSGSTAEAVLRQNAEDGSHRRFLLIQLPEAAVHDDYEYVSDITRARIDSAMEVAKGQLQAPGVRSFGLSLDQPSVTARDVRG
jgi:adenine-specific DNA-methyltransferase